LCSDGLVRELSDALIAELMSGEDVQQCAKALIDATLQAGARDNVTVVVIEAQ
jgi:serine/threonine protein phosphatase PrpC